MQTRPSHKQLQQHNKREPVAEETAADCGTAISCTRSSNYLAECSTLLQLLSSCWILHHRMHRLVPATATSSGNSSHQHSCSSSNLNHYGGSSTRSGNSSHPHCNSN